MNVGMMWFDNDPKKNLTAKIIEAADYYRKKYGQVPDVCMVNPELAPHLLPPNSESSNLGGGEWKVGRITVKAFRAVLPGNLWIGCEETSK